MSENTYVKLFSDAITEEQKESLLKALAASIRWKASYTEQYKGDDENMAVISRCVEELAELHPLPDIA